VDFESFDMFLLKNVVCVLNFGRGLVDFVIERWLWFIVHGYGHSKFVAAFFSNFSILEVLGS
jgi:hypothetical protein